MIPMPLEIKLLIPGYRRRWLNRYECMIYELGDLASKISFGCEDNIPWIEFNDSKIRMSGFWTEKKNQEVYKIIGNKLPENISSKYFRLIKDCLNRYKYPHMRPDMNPSIFPTESMFGFHGQHKDSIINIEDQNDRQILCDAFNTNYDDVIIDCGAFLGFGELHMSPLLTHGHIYAIEADKKCHELMLRNLNYNQINNVTPLHRAIWNEEKELDLQSDFAQANTLVSEVHQGTSLQRVQTITIDKIVEIYSIQKLDMISLTLNGAEVEALSGAKKTLTEFRPRIRLAGWYTRSGRKISNIVRDELKLAGYNVFIGPRGNTMALPK